MEEYLGEQTATGYPDCTYRPLVGYMDIMDSSLVCYAASVSLDRIMIISIQYIYIYFFIIIPTQ